MARCFDNEISDAAFERERAAERDAHREPRRPRYMSPEHRRLQLQAHFADIIASSVTDRRPR